LLSRGKAAVYRRFPFTIILKVAIHDPVVAELRVKIDPGSKTAGIALLSPYRKKVGTYVGRVAVRTTGFTITTAQGTVQGIPYNYCQVVHRLDGSSYQKGEEPQCPSPKEGLALPPHA
jgi:hypothetical protein